MQKFLYGFRPYALLTLLWALVALPGIATLPVMDRDEARFVQATRQMLESGDFVVVRFQDELRAKKPVGIYWLQAAAVSTFSHVAKNEVWAWRLPSALGTLLAVLMTFRVGQTLFNRQVAFLAASLLATSLMVAVESHLAKTDGVLLGLTTFSLGCFALIYAHGKGIAPAPRWAALGLWIGVGCAMLVKGPVMPLILILMAAGLAIADRSMAFLRGVRPVMGVLVSAAIVAPWLSAVSSQTQGAFVQRAVAEDLLPKLLGAQESHGAWPGYYLLLAGLTAFPASLFLWPALMRAWRQRTTVAMRLCLLWVGPGWLVFELVPTKLPHYTLPFYPPLMLMIASALFAVRDDTWQRLTTMPVKVWYGVWSLLVVALAAAAQALPMVYGSGFSLWSLPPVLALLAGLFAVWHGLLHRRLLHAAMAAMAAAVVFYASLLAGESAALPRLWVSQRVVTALEEVAPRALTAQQVAVAGYHEPSLVFLAGTRTALVSGDAAARFLVDRAGSADGAAAVVESRSLEQFRATLEQLGRKMPEALATVEGFNYSRGKPVTLSVFALPAVNTPAAIPVPAPALAPAGAPAAAPPPRSTP